MTQPETNSGETAGEQHICKFPVAYDPENAADPFVPSGHAMPEVPVHRGRGRPSEYCGEERIDPDGVRRRHDRATAFQRRRELKLEAAGRAPRKAGPPPRPVTSSRASLRELLAEIQMTATSHREQMGQLLDRVTDVVATAGDPDAAVAEVARIRAEAQAEIDAATARAGEAEQDAITARRERDRALEDKTLAEGAAEDAISDRDEQVAAAQSETEQARRDAEQARVERDAAVAEAGQRIAQAEQAAEERIAAIQADAEDRIDQARSEAQARIDRAAEQLQQATVERNAAISERAGAEQAAADARAETERMRRELTETQAGHREELTQLRRDITAVRTEAREDREQLRSDHAAEVARIQESAAAQVNALRQALSTAESTNSRLESANSRLESEIARMKGAQ
ncbi:hypothetical protein ACIG56_34250 [Nocardia fusca]|uniref:hypothetical protein n=1 Tax=Nocardia fusca TaxID=941183 RepID=UPI0037C62368